MQVTKSNVKSLRKGQRVVERLNGKVYGGVLHFDRLGRTPNKLFFLTDTGFTRFFDLDRVQPLLETVD